jgi:hypothetical protein
MINLSNSMIEKLKARTTMEIDRDICSISVTDQEITINQDWAIQRQGKTIIQSVINSIKEYCTKSNIEWECNSTYSAWCD